MLVQEMKACYLLCLAREDRLFFDPHVPRQARCIDRRHRHHDLYLVLTSVEWAIVMALLSIMLGLAATESADSRPRVNSAILQVTCPPDCRLTLHAFALAFGTTLSFSIFSFFLSA